MQGRVHLYEGYSAKEVAFPIRVFARMGKGRILTNAREASTRILSGPLVVISDHINLQGVNPLTGRTTRVSACDFNDMTSAYDKRFREMTVGEANRLGIGMYEGVYAGLLVQLRRPRRYATYVQSAPTWWDVHGSGSDCGAAQRHFAC